ncbi:MAG: outer membrane beta-barrel protein [Bacteroidia bacterium]|nr:outer membrane beta-barrel protein [Bacteroidia bacterium]
MKKLLFLMLLSLGVLPSLLAQKQRDPVKFGLGLTANHYLGDYSDPNYIRIYSGGAFSLQKASRRNVNLHLRVGFGRFADQFEGEELPLGSDGLPLPRFVETNFLHGELALTYRFFPQKRFQPFVHGGFGWLYFNPKDLDGRKLIRNQAPTSQGASTNTIVPQLPIGLGFEVRLNQLISIETSYSYRFTPTDYLDNYGQSDAINSFDALQSINISFMFSIGKGPELPPKKVKSKEKEDIEIIIED